jgi:hypothetical protein
MAKDKNKLNKTNSSGWLDNYSEEFSISKYQDGGKLKQYFKLPTKRVAIDNTYNKNSPKLDSSDDKEMVNRLLREKANESQKAKEKRIADVKRLEELNKKSMLETANAKDLYDIGEGMKSKYRFSNEDNFFDDYINPLNMVGGMAGGLAQTPELINQGEYLNAALNVATPLTVGALAGIGTQNAGQFVNNLVNPLAGTRDLFKQGTKTIGVNIGENINSLGRLLPSGSLKSNIRATGMGIRDVSQGRPFFETFPITSSQKRVIENRQDEEFQKGVDFLKNWAYGKSSNPFLKNNNTLRPEVEKRINNINPDILRSKFSNADLRTAVNPFNVYENLLVNNKKSFLNKDSRLTEDAKEFIINNKGTIGGVNTGEGQSITLRNEGFYYHRPETIGEVAAHETAHTFQKLGNDISIAGDPSTIAETLATNHLDHLYQIANKNTTFGKYMGDAMVEPKKGKYVWAASPLEPHAELMAARFKVYDHYKDKFGDEKAMEMLQNPTDELLDKLIETKDLNRFFKPSTDNVIKRDILRNLPAFAPATIGLGAASQFYNGQGEGEINQYEDGGKVKDKKSTLSKLKKALSLKENLGNLDTKEGYFTPLNQLLRTAVGIEGKDYSNEPMEPIAREQDALRMYLGLPSKTGAFEQTAPNKYRIRDYNKLYPDTLLSDEAVRDWGVPNEDGVPDPVNPAFDLYPYDDFVMGKHYVTKGKDAKGEYLKYSDRFDFDPTRYANQFIDRNVNPSVGKYLKKATPLLDELENLMFNPFELEDKIYYDPKTKLRSDIILQQNAPKVYPGQPMAVPPEFADGGKTNNDMKDKNKQTKSKEYKNTTNVKNTNVGFGLDIMQSLAKLGKKSALRKIPYIGAGIDLATSGVSSQTPFNFIPHPGMAGATYFLDLLNSSWDDKPEAEKKQVLDNMQKVQQEMQGVQMYPAGGYLNYQDSYKGFGVGPQLYQDNSYFRSVMPDNIENIEEQINQPSVFSGINDVLGAVNQGVSQATGLLSQFGNMSGNMPQIMPDISNWQAPGTAPKTNEQLNFENSDAYLNWQNDQKLKQAGLFDSFYSNQNTQTGTGFMGNTPTVKTVPSPNNFNWNINTPLFNLPTGKNGGYLKKYQDGGMMDMLPVGYPEYIHKSNVFHENYNPVPRVHFSDDTTPYDMGVNLNDLVNMYGGRVGKYQYGGMMPFYSRQRSPRVFNSNANRASAADLESAYANDFMHTKVRKDRQSFEDDKVDWGFMDWAKEPVGAYLGMMSTVPIVGDITKDIVGDSFLTRTGGYAVGKGVGNVTSGAAKIIGGVATGNVGMIGSGVGNVGEGVGSTIGTFQAKDALSNYDKSGYVSGNRLVRSSQDFGNMMDTASGLFGNIKGGVGMVKNMGGMKGMLGNMKGGATGMKGFGNVMGKLTGFGQDGGYIDYDFNNIEEYKYGGKVSQKINKKQNKAGWLDQL